MITIFITPPPSPPSSLPSFHLSFPIEQVLMERLVSAGSSLGLDLQAPCPPRAPTPTHLPSPLALLGLLAAPWPGSLLPSDSASSVLCPPIRGWGWLPGRGIRQCGCNESAALFLSQPLLLGSERSCHCSVARKVPGKNHKQPSPERQHLGLNCVLLIRKTINLAAASLVGCVFFPPFFFF